MKLIRLILILLCSLFVTIIFCDRLISLKAKDRTYNSLEDVPEHGVGLLLGVGKYTSSGNINIYYSHRLNAAVNLFEAGKINAILVSGDNSKPTYDEPTQFKEDLIAKGIPEECIYLDFAGFRTLDSIVRANKIFGLSSFLIISQEFHNERAIFLARHHKLDVNAFNAKAVTGRFSVRTNLREYLARTKACLDVVFNVQPKFLGDSVYI